LNCRKSRARDAALQAISSPLLECSIENTRNIIINVTGGHDATLAELCGIAPDIIYEAVDPNLHLNVNQIFGIQADESIEGEIQVSMIVTGFADRIP
jgi:cell division protein FtsZ